MSVGHTTFRSHLIAGAVATIVATSLSYYLHGTKVMHLYDELNFDAWTQGQEESRHDLLLVVVDDESYLEDFQLTSPLEQKKVQQLISAVAQKGARLIGVDLDTRDWDPAILAEVPALVRARVAWARLPLGMVRERNPNRRARYASLLELQLCGGSVIFGTSDVHHTEEGSVTGIIRTMPHSVSIDGVLYPPFGDLVAWMAKQGPQACSERRAIEPEGEYIRFLKRNEDGRPYVPTIVSAHALLTSSTGNLDGAVVLIGSMFAEGADVVPTPFGPQSGIAVHADVVHTRMEGTPYRSWTARDYLVLDLLLGFMVVAFGWLTRSHAGWFWIGLLSIGGAALIASLGAFQFTSRYMSIWPVLLGVGLHEAVEHLAPQYWRTIWGDLHRLLPSGAAPAPGSGNPADSQSSTPNGASREQA